MLTLKTLPKFVAEIGRFVNPNGKSHAKSGEYRQCIARAFNFGQNKFAAWVEKHPIPLNSAICARIADEFERAGLGTLPRCLADFPLPRHFPLTADEIIEMWQAACRNAYERREITVELYETYHKLEPFIRSAGGGNWIVCASSPVPLFICKAVLAPQIVKANPNDWSRYHDQSGRRGGDTAFYEGLRAFHDNHYEEAFAFFQAAAKEQHGEAFFQLGWLTEEGKGCAPDVAAAIDYYERAAALGVKLAHQNLGSIFCVDSDFAARDMRRAVYHFEQGVAAGLCCSMSSLGRILWHGTGVERDTKRAKQLLQAAAQGRDAHALNTLATIYEQEDGTKGEAEAFKMYCLAMHLTHVSENALPAYNLARCYQHGKGVDKNLRTARRLYKLAAQAGDVNAQLVLGAMALERIRSDLRH